MAIRQSVPKTEKHTFFVTGAAGFIGSSVCRRLLNQSKANFVVGVDNINPYYSVHIKKRRITELSSHTRFTFYTASILDREKVSLIVKTHKPATVIHTAAEVGVRNGETNPIQYFTTNVLGTVTLLEGITAHARHIIILSSSSVYGTTRTLPYSEDEPITLKTPLSVYGNSKAAMEMAVYNFFNRTGISTTIVRPFSVYGPDGRPDMLPMKLLTAARLGKSLEIYAPTKNYRDWTYIDDFVESIIAIQKKPKGFRTVNIGSGKPLRLDRTLAIAQKVIKEYGYPLGFIQRPANKTEVLKTHAKTSTLQNVYNVRAKTEFEEGFRKTAAFFFSHEELYV